jgi:hypothetical protein
MFNEIDEAEGRGIELTEPSETSQGSKSEQQGPVCTVGFCPICMAVTAAQPLKPELIEHLLAAGREFLLAAKAILEARTEHVAGGDGQGGNSQGGNNRHVEKIDIE